MSDVVARLNAALKGRYAIERELGEGGMATVYLADDLKHERKVALKVLRPELAAVVGADRFIAEIKTTANLQHPHILPLFDSGEADSFLFYVMPYVEGETLQGRIDREKQLPVDEAVRIATAVANALDHAHRNKVIHRDIKPANILLQDGEPMVADFGIALAVGAAGGHRLTETGLSVGTPFYMSPEQATGDQIVGVQSDVYALACVLYEMLVGEPPYTGTTAQAVLGKIIQGAPVSATSIRGSIPTNVDAAMVRALEKLPADRFTGAQDFAKALADPGFRHGESVEAGVAAGVGPWKRLTIAGWGAAAAFAVALGWTLLRPEPPRPVERFESPFRDAQGPVVFTQQSLNLSPDGSMVVYRGPGPSGGTIQLWVRRWDDLDAVPVRGTVGAGEPSVSPDGRELAFSQGFEIKVLAFEGGPIRTLTTGSWPRWGPDGYIYASVAGGSVRVPATGGPADTVTQFTGDDAFHAIFDFLPGGESALLHVNLPGGEFESRAVNLATGEMKLLMFGEAPLYSSTGHLVARVDGTLMAAPFDPKAVELRGPAVALVDGVASHAMSRTGSLVYMTGAAGAGVDDTELVWMTRSGSATPLQPGWAFDRGGTNFGWSLSPDGARVALRRRTEGNNDIWIKELPAGPLRRLTFDEGEATGALVERRRPNSAVLVGRARAARRLVQARRRHRGRDTRARRRAQPGTRHLEPRRGVARLPNHGGGPERGLSRYRGSTPRNGQHGDPSGGDERVRRARTGRIAGRAMARVLLERDRSRRGVRASLPGRRIGQGAGLDRGRNGTTLGPQRARVVLRERKPGPRGRLDRDRPRLPGPRAGDAVHHPRGILPHRGYQLLRRRS